MKKSILFGMTLLFASAAFVSCSKSNDFEEIAQENMVQTVETEYNQAFIKAFGQPDVNQDWGFAKWDVAATRSASSIAKRAGEGTPTPDFMIIGEDLSASQGTDFDFNDIVIGVVTGKNSKIIIYAAGGTLPLRFWQGKGKNSYYTEIHEAFGVDTDVMVNTGVGESKEPVVFESDFNIPNENSAKEIKIEVFKNGAWMELKAEQGVPAAKICVDYPFEWCAEREPIQSKYPNFSEWVQNVDYVWW